MFSLTTNQRTVLSVIASFQLSEQGCKYRWSSMICPLASSCILGLINFCNNSAAWIFFSWLRLSTFSHFSVRVIFQSWQLCATSSVIVSVTWQLDYSEFICNILLCYNLNLFFLCDSWTFSFYTMHYVNGGLIFHVHICYTFVIITRFNFLLLEFDNITSIVQVLDVPQP
jgi:hypothetical protein